MNDKNFEKNNIKMVIKILQYTVVLSFTQFGKYSILGRLTLPKNTLTVSIKKNPTR